MAFRSKPTPPACKALATWLTFKGTGGGPADLAARGRSALAALTGQDARALAAFAHAVELYAVSDSTGRMHALAAMGHLVNASQNRPNIRRIFKEAIAHGLDWSDRDRLWREMGFGGWSEEAGKRLEANGVKGAAILGRRVDEIYEEADARKKARVEESRRPNADLPDVPRYPYDNGPLYLGEHGVM